MNPIARNTLAVVVGLVVGSVVNMALISAGTAVVPLPEGSDDSTMEGLREAMKSFTPANFMVPLVAHALGTLAGAFVAAKLAASHHSKCALGIAVFFLFGGIAAVAILGGPVWFIACDLVFAYVPMGILGARLARGSRPADA